MGALYSDRCYSTTAKAVDAYYGSAPPAFTSGSTSYLTEYVWTGTLWQMKRYSIASSGTVTTLTASTAPTPTFPTCDEMETFTDGLTLGFGVVVAMVAAYVFYLYRRAL